MRLNDAEKVSPGLVFHLPEKRACLCKGNGHNRQRPFEAKGIEVVKGGLYKIRRGNHTFLSVTRCSLFEFLAVRKCVSYLFAKSDITKVTRVEGDEAHLPNIGLAVLVVSSDDEHRLWEHPRFWSE